MDYGLYVMDLWTLYVYVMYYGLMDVCDGCL